MKVLDSPADALALNPVNLGTLLTAAINGLWAWLAVVTAAAFSFWRPPQHHHLRQASPISAPEPNTTPSLSTYHSEPDTTSFGVQKKEETTPVVATTSFRGKVTKEEEGVLTTGDSVTNRFRVTYYKEEERENDDDDGDDDEMEGGDEAVVKRWATGRRLTVEIASRDFGLEWYGYQHRGVIDGSVVRLWEEERESSCYSSARSCRRRSAIGATASPLVFA